MEAGQRHKLSSGRMQAGERCAALAWEHSREADGRYRAVVPSLVEIRRELELLRMMTWSALEDQALTRELKLLVQAIVMLEMAMVQEAA